MSLGSPGVPVQAGGSLPVQADLDRPAVGAHGHRVPLVRAEGPGMLLGIRAHDPGPAAGLVQTTRVADGVDLRLETADPAEAALVDAEVEAAVAAQGPVLDPGEEVAEFLVGDQVPEGPLRGEVGAGEHPVRDAPVPGPDRVPAGHARPVEEHALLAPAQIPQPEAAEAHGGTRVVDLERDVAHEVGVVEVVGRANPVHPGLDVGAHAADAVAVPLAHAECLTADGVLPQVRDPAATVLVVEAPRPSACRGVDLDLEAAHASGLGLAATDLDAAVAGLDEHLAGELEVPVASIGHEPAEVRPGHARRGGPTSASPSNSNRADPVTVQPERSPGFHRSFHPDDELGRRGRGDARGRGRCGKADEGEGCEEGDRERGR